ncbi:hypothetical protein PIB30_040207 [Stylosanthes scabra]|uniref:Aminotransferase-like plant mobile domain-containing protein n=1 Tax=Stylosanthes scabra TaxID=79078 RepID=A0ABU6REM4_9FABA|nr:hypothetical protein [Stylosanthes scabra]
MGLWTAVCPLIYFGSIEWHQVDRVIPQFGGVQNHPHRPLNIDFLHAKDGRGGDRWFPTTYQLWHVLWASRHDQTFVVEEAQDPGPSAEYLRWWYLAAKRYLAHDDAFHPRPADEIPAEAFQRMMGEEDEVAAPRRVRRMPEGGGRRGSRGGGRSRGRASAAQGQGQHGASTSGAHQPGPSHAGPSQAGPSQDSWISTTPQHHFESSTPVLGSPSQDFLVGLNSPGFQRHLQQIFTGDTVYRPEFDESSRMSQMDLNEPASAPSQIFMAHAGTPPSAYVPDPYALVSDPAPAGPPQDDAVPITDADDGGTPRGRGRRVPRRRACGTGGHM